MFTNKDIDRISKHLNLKPIIFISEYLRIDEDGDYVLKSTPCKFLQNNNYCSIYDVRPKACAEYPHTDRKKQHQILNLNLKNTEVCPGVFEIFEKVKSKIYKNVLESDQTFFCKFDIISRAKQTYNFSIKLKTR